MNGEWLKLYIKNF